MLERLPGAAILDVLGRQGYSRLYMEGVRPLTPGQKLVGRAVTLRFLPFRPDLAQEKGQREESPEYRAMELCGPGDVLVIDAMGEPYASVGGDVKFLRLKLRRAAGLVADGAVRDMVTVRTYGFPVFARGPTAKAGGGILLPYEVNGYIQCGNVLVKPGDVIIGDDDGVVVLPQQLAQEVVSAALEHEEIEAVVKEALEREGASPGVYYPFNEATERLYQRVKGRSFLRRGTP